MVQISQWCVHRTNTMWCSCSYKIRKTSWPRSRLPLSTLDLFLASRVWVVQNWRSAINSISGETFWKWGCISIPSWEQDIPWQSHVWWISKQTCKASSEEFVYFPFPIFFGGLDMFLHVSCDSYICWFVESIGEVFLEPLGMDSESDAWEKLIRPFEVANSVKPITCRKFVPFYWNILELANLPLKKWIQLVCFFVNTYCTSACSQIIQPTCCTFFHQLTEPFPGYYSWN